MDQTLMDDAYSRSGYIVDLHDRTIFPGRCRVLNGVVDRIEPADEVPDQFLLPGLIDAHVHVESSMLPPSEFARVAVVHGTVGSVSDPHEIANVLGVDGVDYMLDDSQRVPFRFAFGAPSCVPATPFETAGAEIDADAVEALLDRQEIPYLSEMMNVPGVLNGDPDVRAKIEAARRRGKPRDGHAPGVRGEDARAYAEAGIQTDHECVAIEEAREKLDAGMKIAIREGSAAKNFDALIPLIDEAPERIMFCSDDKHPDDLADGHINVLVRRALDRGYNRFDVLRAACVHPVEQYGMNVGLLREGDPADFIIVDGLNTMNVLETHVGGVQVADRGESLIDRTSSAVVNRFEAGPIEPAELRVPADGARIRVITASDNELVTGEEIADATLQNGAAVADPQRDLLKIAVVNRYRDAEPSVAFIRGFGLTEGALASSVAHDSHNVVAVGASDEALARAVNAVIDARGGISAADANGETKLLPLPIAGLMTDEPYPDVARAYTQLAGFAQTRLGSSMDAPFMTLSFMALLVIPQLKLSDRGLFDGDAFHFVDRFVDG
jgi:adenine deaminase